MLLQGRHFFARMGRFELFAEGWKRQAGEPLVSSLRGCSGVATEVQLWMPGVHLVVSRLHRGCVQVG